MMFEIAMEIFSVLFFIMSLLFYYKDKVYDALLMMQLAILTAIFSK